MFAGIGVVGVALVAVIVYARSGGSSRHGASASNTTTTSSTTSTTVAADPNVHLIATASTPHVSVFDAPNDATPSHEFDNPWFINDDPKAAVPLVFLVQEQRDDGWLHVLLPIRPNASTGWVRASDVTVTPTSYRIVVELSAHRLRAFKGDTVVVDDTVAVGAPGTPTPAGSYFIRALLKSPTPNSVYGPYAYGLSGYSEALQTFDGGDAELGIHGNNDASVLGSDVTHGCVRMSNDAITRLVPLLPLGTPVEIVA